MPKLCAGSSLLWLEAWGLACKAAALSGRTPCSPCEIDYDVSPALLHLSEGQWSHVAPDFQRFLDGPSHFGFYKLPWEPDNSEKKQTLDEESTSRCATDTAVMKTSLGSVSLGVPLPLSTRTSPIHTSTAPAPSSKQHVQQINPISVETLWLVGPEVSSPESFADLGFSEAMQLFPGLSPLSPAPQRSLGVV